MNNETHDPVEQEDDGEHELVARIRGSQSSDTVVRTRLQTDDRVIARVTDGIYRRPGSALRELISNAYDADATRVVIKTDAPRFKRISVEDNGHGMSPEALAYLLLHIGGSAKRNDVGAELGIASQTDPTRSPKGRRLIGKIGIGLFSVSQLTYTFQIITKVSGDDFRTIATVALRQYSEDDFSHEHAGGGKIETGKVSIWREKAVDVNISGTTLVLTNIRPQARDSLRSAEIWSAIELNDSVRSSEERQAIEPPAFHIGRVDTADSSEQLLKKSQGHFSRVPWKESDSPADAFGKLVWCVWEEIEGTNPNPQLARIFDNYLRMVWQLSLAVPLPYVDQHLFDMDMSLRTQTFVLSNLPKGSAVPAEICRPGRIRDNLKLRDTAESLGAFDVFFDDLKLSRPIRFTGLPVTNHALKQPIVFIGKCREGFPSVAREFSGGPLAFEAYLFWTPKVAPTEHQGSLIRIHGSSGTLFDPTFMRYRPRRRSPDTPPGPAPRGSRRPAPGAAAAVAAILRAGPPAGTPAASLRPVLGKRAAWRWPARRAAANCCSRWSIRCCRRSFWRCKPSFWRCRRSFCVAGPCRRARVASTPREAVRGRRADPQSVAAGPNSARRVSCQGYATLPKFVQVKLLTPHAEPGNRRPESLGAFDVFFDDLKLSRPIRFTGLPVTNHALKQPIVFIGKCREGFPALLESLAEGHSPLRLTSFGHQKWLQPNIRVR